MGAVEPLDSPSELLWVHLWVRNKLDIPSIITIYLVSHILHGQGIYWWGAVGGASRSDIPVLPDRLLA